MMSDVSRAEDARETNENKPGNRIGGIAVALAPAAAQDWPTKTVKIVVPFGPGSTPDMVARLIADRLQQKLGQSFVIENKPGASGNLGTDAVAKAEPDGATTIGISIGGPLAINTLLFSKLPYDPAKDIAPITQLITSRARWWSTARWASIRWRSWSRCSSASPASTISARSATALCRTSPWRRSRSRAAHDGACPYPGSPQAMTAVLRGDVAMACLPAIAVTRSSSPAR